ncbi:MAG: exo-alpha-sialidase, partial [Bacteroidota bacterium]
KDWWNGRNKLSIAVSSDTKTWTDIYALEDKAEGEFSYPALIQTRDGVIHILYTYNRFNIRHVALKLENE